MPKNIDTFYDDEDMDDKSTNHFIIMWCCEGLECVIPFDLNNLSEGADMLAKLEDRKNTYAQQINSMINNLTLRAKFNSQRHYEIYSLTTSEDITKETLENCFESEAQMIVDLIREKGMCIFSERATGKTKIV